MIIQNSNRAKEGFCRRIFFSNVIKSAVVGLIALYASPNVLAKTPIPQMGPWTLDGKTRSALIKTFRDEAEIVITVNPCGDRINIVHPSLRPNGIIYLQFTGDEYFGSGWFVDKKNNEGGISFSLIANSPKVLKGQMKLDLGDVSEQDLAELDQLPQGIREISLAKMRSALKQDWTVTIRAARSRQKENYGYGELRIVDVLNQADGVFRSETVQYQLVLSDFDPNSHELLSNHLRWLDTSIATAKSKLSGAPPMGGLWCEKKQTWRPAKTGDWDFNGAVVGFADRTLEKNNWRTIASDRAQVTADYLENGGMGAPARPRIGGLYYEVHEGGPNYVGPVGLGGEACMRAAIAAFDVETRWAEPYTKDQTDKWLRQWLRVLHPDTEKFSNEERGGMQPRDFASEEDRIFARQDAKEWYCFANGLLEDLKDVGCPENPSYAYNALGGQDGGTRDRVKGTYLTLDRTGIFKETQWIDKAQDLANSGRQSFCSQEVKDEADKIESEKELFGSATPWLEN